MESSCTSDTSWSSATNWIVAGGSLKNSVTFESSLSLVNDDENDNNDQSSPVDSNSESPLILYSSSPNCTPCEITVTFAQKHEVKQVYIRSTARIYEIYYALELGNSSEYLCTVRCGIATRDEEVLHATDIEQTVLAHQKGSTRELTEERLRNGSGLASNEDDWVEVKILDTSLVVNGNSSLPSNSNTSQGRISQAQDLFEATAEITDASPCMSITLRLLSLQNKGCVCIDEVYVFADPVDAVDLDNKVGPTESSAGSSLMAMLMPTFLELSKTKSVGRAQDNYDTNKMNGQKSEIVEAKPSDLTDAGNKILQREKSSSAYYGRMQSQEPVTHNAKPVALDIPPQVSETESKHDMPNNHIEGVLNQLVSRVNRIEDLFLRFEDCMLKPIRSIDERLQRVELHLEVLTRKTQHSGLHSCTRICAPEFSCSESETNSLYNSGCGDLGYAACEATKKDSIPAMSSIPSDVTPVLMNATKSHPSLVVTAPEFSNGDDEEECDAVEYVKESPKEQPKNAMSIDDALASALAGFLSSTSAQSPKYSKALEVKAPEFLNEEGNNSEKTASPKTPTCCCELEGTECLRSTFSSLSNFSSLESDEIETRLPNNNNCVKTGKGVNEQLQNSEAEEGGDAQGSLVNVILPAMNYTAIKSSGQMTDDIENEEVGNGTGETSEPEKFDFLDQFSVNQINDDSEVTKDCAVFNESVSRGEIAKERCDLDILQSVVEFSHVASKVDFEIPILEVKFTSEENLDAKSPLEALLAGIPDSNVEANSVKESSTDNSQSGYEFNLIPMEDCGAMGSATDSNIHTYADNYNLTALPLNAENEIHYFI